MIVLGFVSGSLDGLEIRRTFGEENFSSQLLPSIGDWVRDGGAVRPVVDRLFEYHPHGGEGAHVTVTVALECSKAGPTHDSGAPATGPSPSRSRAVHALARRSKFHSGQKLTGYALEVAQRHGLVAPVARLATLRHWLRR